MSHNKRISPTVPSQHRFLLSPQKALWIVFLFFCLSPMGVQAGQITLAWDPPSTNYGGFILAYGTTSGNYTYSQNVGSQTTYTVSSLNTDQVYYFAVKAYNSTGKEESLYSNEVSAMVPVPAPMADFYATPTSGIAPMAVAFTDASSGRTDKWSWNFGDGGLSTQRHPTHTYSKPGTYTVSLTVSGEGGSNTRTKTGFVLVSTLVGGSGSDGGGGNPPPLLSRNGWGIWVDSEADSRYAGTNVLDGNAATIWHTPYSGVVPPHAHHLVVDLKAVATIQGFRALPRQDTSANGQIGRYELYIKTNSGTSPTSPTNPVASEWTLVTSGTFPNTKAEQQVLFGAVKSRYVWLKVLSEVQGTNRPWTSLAEFNVVGTYDSSVPPPLLSRNGWGVWVDSEAAPRYVGTNVLDGNASTFWHTPYSGVVPSHAHHLVVDLKAVATIQGFRALPRQDTSANGQIGRYELYIKTNSGTPPTSPTKPVASEWTLVTSGTFPNTKAEQQVLFGAVKSRYVWLKVLSEVQGTNAPWTSLAEFNVVGTY